MYNQRECICKAFVFEIEVFLCAHVMKFMLFSNACSDSGEIGFDELMNINWNYDTLTIKIIK